MKTILIVDDELANAEVLSLILEDEGYRVFTASNGRHGLERIAEVEPQLVILDYMMPIMNGADMGKAVRASAKTRHIKILMNSSLPVTAITPMFDGFDAFLRKPYNVDAALQVIAKLLNE